MVEFKQKFIDDATDLLADLEQTLLQLENDCNNGKLIEEVFRVMHTLKGTASMYGYELIGILTHELETVFDLIRNGCIGLSKELLGITFSSVDLLYKALKEDESEELKRLFMKCQEQLLKFTGTVDQECFENKMQVDEELLQNTQGVNTWFITVKPDSDLSKRGIKINQIFDDLETVGKTHIFTRLQSEKGKPEYYWEVILATNENEDGIRDVFLFVDDIVDIKLLAENDLFEDKSFVEKIESLTDESEIDFNELKEFVKHLTEVEEENNNEEAKTVNGEGRFQESIKVASERLDEQMNLLSELVTIKAEIQLMVQKSGDKELMKPVEQLAKLTRRFRRNIFKIRLMPLGSLQIRFDRLIRDLTLQLNKKVRFVTEGMNTELDKTIIDSLESPLMHLIRNCLDHGIEECDTRKKKGKEETGTIKLTARAAATNVYITVSDDGDGIDTNKIYQKALEKGIVDKKSKPSEEELFDMIFMPGFSTAHTLSEVSGRGVGMDVVRQTIQNLRGSIEVKSSKGEGSSFVIKLPLSLSIIDTMLVRAGQLFYSVPLASIEKCTEIISRKVDDYDNQHLEIDGQLLPYVKVQNKLKIDPKKEKNKSTPEKWKVVIVKQEELKTALLVDEVIGEHQAVLKPMGDYFKNLDYISGATQLADGRIAFVLDVTRFIN